MSPGDKRSLPPLNYSSPLKSSISKSAYVQRSVDNSADCSPLLSSLIHINLMRMMGYTLKGHNRAQRIIVDKKDKKEDTDSEVLEARQDGHKEDSDSEVLEARQEGQKEDIDSEVLEAITTQPQKEDTDAQPANYKAKKERAHKTKKERAQKTVWRSSILEELKSPLTREMSKKTNIFSPDSLNLKRSRSGRWLVPPLDRSRQEEILYSMDGTIVGIKGQKGASKSPTQGTGSKLEPSTSMKKLW